MVLKRVKYIFRHDKHVALYNLIFFFFLIFPDDQLKTSFQNEETLLVVFVIMSASDAVFDRIDHIDLFLAFMNQLIQAAGFILKDKIGLYKFDQHYLVRNFPFLTLSLQ